MCRFPDCRGDGCPGVVGGDGVLIILAGTVEVYQHLYLGGVAVLTHTDGAEAALLVSISQPLFFRVAAPPLEGLEDAEGAEDAGFLEEEEEEAGFLEEEEEEAGFLEEEGTWLSAFWEALLFSFFSVFSVFSVFPMFSFFTEEEVLLLSLLWFLFLPSSAYSQSFLSLLLLSFLPALFPPPSWSGPLPLQTPPAALLCMLPCYCIRIHCLGESIGRS